jgi:hypothetical protein
VLTRCVDTNVENFCFMLGLAGCPLRQALYRYEPVYLDRGTCHLKCKTIPGPSKIWGILLPALFMGHLYDLLLYVILLDRLRMYMQRRTVGSGTADSV